MLITLIYVIKSGLLASQKCQNDIYCEYLTLKLLNLTPSY